MILYIRPSKARETHVLVIEKNAQGRICPAGTLYKYDADKNRLRQFIQAETRHVQNRLSTTQEGQYI